MYVQPVSDSKVTNEYGGDFRRLLPCPETVETPWGSAWMIIKPGTSLVPHDHDERETFIILKGRGEMTVNDETRVVSKGDVVYLPPFSQHSLVNTAETDDLELLSIWWDAAVSA